MSAYRGKYVDELIANAAYIGTPGKGILAADESNGIIGKRFSRINIENVQSNRRALRELLFTAPDVLQYLSGVILFEETLYQKTASSKPFVDVLKEGGVLPRIKVDQGIVELAGTNGETTTQGLDGLAQCCQKYYEVGARPTEPSRLSIQKNANGLARYAIICQENGLLEGTLLKPNMVTLGFDAKKASLEVIAEYAVRALLRTTHVVIFSIVFLSGGQSEEEATLNLNAMNQLKGNKSWFLSFSFGRALQQNTLKANSEATLGIYKGDAKLGEGQGREGAGKEGPLGRYLSNLATSIASSRATTSPRA
ncbi:unnamed protein product [Malus baccata var. baccata]